MSRNRVRDLPWRYGSPEGCANEVRKAKRKFRKGSKSKQRFLEISERLIDRDGDRRITQRSQEIRQ